MDQVISKKVNRHKNDNNDADAFNRVGVIVFRSTDNSFDYESPS